MQLKVNSTIVNILTTSGENKFINGHNRDTITITFDMSKITVDGLLNLFKDFSGDIELFDNNTGERYIHSDYHVLIQAGAKQITLGTPSVTNPNPSQLVSFIELGKLTDVEKNMRFVNDQQHEIEFLKMMMGVE